MNIRLQEWEDLMNVCMYVYVYIALTLLGFLPCFLSNILSQHLSSFFNANNCLLTAAKRVSTPSYIASVSQAFPTTCRVYFRYVTECIKSACIAYRGEGRPGPRLTSIYIYMHNVGYIA